MGEETIFLAVGILASLGGVVLMLGDTPVEQLLAKTEKVAVKALQRGQDRLLVGKVTGTPSLKGVVTDRDVVFQQVVAYRYERDSDGDRQLREISRGAEWTPDLGLDDGTGTVLLDPTEGEFSLQRVVRQSKSALGKPWPRSAPPDADVVEEWVILPGEQVMVVGNARGAAQTLVVGGKRHFMLTNSTLAELHAHHRNLRIVGGLLTVGGIAAAVIAGLAAFSR